MRKFETMNGVAPYNPLARSLAKVARSSRYAGTYATAMNDMKAEPKNYIHVRVRPRRFLMHVQLTMALVNGCMYSWEGCRRSHTVPIIIANPVSR